MSPLRHLPLIAGLVAFHDVQDPANPVETGRWEGGADLRALALDGDRAWVADGTHGLVELDLSGAEPALARVYGEIPDSIRALTWKDGRLVLTVADWGVEVIDPSRPPGEELRAWTRTDGHPFGHAVDGAALPGGVYLARLSTAAGTGTTKLLLVK